MLNFAMMKPLGALLKRMDIPKLAEKLATVDLDLFNYEPEGNGAEEKERAEAAEKEKEKAGKIIIVEIAERLEDVADDLVRLCAAYKGCTFDEMMKQDPFEILKELLSEDGFAGFFKNAVQSVSRK